LVAGKGGRTRRTPRVRRRIETAPAQHREHSRCIEQRRYTVHTYCADWSLVASSVQAYDDPQSLEDEFREIVGTSISCDIQMDEHFDDKEKACNDPESDVRLNGVPLSCPTEWRVKPDFDDIIELVGSACDTFKSGDVTFSAEFPCGAIVVE
jgi:hypothetical protein